MSVRRSTPPLWLLVAVTASGTLAMHILVPALPAMATTLAVDAGTIQLAITLYLVGLALGQLIYGPLSDRIGRRPALLAGLSLYVGASLVCAIASSGAMLIAGRVIQALGGCSGLVLGRAVVRDTATVRETAGRLALVNMTMALAPAVAPLIGGVVVAMVGWRAIFYGLAVIGGATLIATIVRLPETRPAAPAGPVARGGLRRLGRSRAFVGYAVAGASSTTSFYAFTAASPFIFATQLHRPPETLGVIYMVLFLGISAGGLGANRLVRRRIAPGQLLAAANLLGLFGAALLLLVDQAGWLSVPTLMLTMLLFTVGIGCASPLALTGAVSAVPGVVGMASGVYGCLQMGYGALCTLIVAAWQGRPGFVVACVLLGSSVLGQAALRLAGPRGIG